MPEPTFALTADDDLPRTIRREREAREREAREREAKERERGTRERKSAAASSAPEPVLDHGRDGDTTLEMSRPPAATVVALDVPFGKLAMFFVRSVFAAIPALLVLTALLWAFGHTLELFFPQLLKMKILIYVP